YCVIFILIGRISFFFFNSKPTTTEPTSRLFNDNLFRSEIFSNTVATLIGHEIEIYNTTGAVGAARAVGLKDGDYSKFGANVSDNDHVMTFLPLHNKEPYETAYKKWKQELELILTNK
ncbi:hypothetical protein ABXT05_20520, partial [Flavobacterium johnsoniae]